MSKYGKIKGSIVKRPQISGRGPQLNPTNAQIKAVLRDLERRVDDAMRCTARLSAKMTDLVERLRLNGRKITFEAADEIERLRALLMDMRYLQCRVDYVTKGHLSHANYLTEKEKGLNLYIEPTAAWMQSVSSVSVDSNSGAA